MENNVDITEEVTPTDTHVSTKPKSKKGMIIGIIAIAIVAILLISFMPMSRDKVEGKWLVEKTVTYNPDGSVRNSLDALAGGGYWEFRSDGKLIMGNNSGSFEDLGGTFNNFTWKYTGNNEIEITLTMIIANETESMSIAHEYEVDGDILTLSSSAVDSDATITMFFNRAES